MFGELVLRRNRLILSDYAWKALWPIRGTVDLAVGLGTEQICEFSLTYDLPRTEQPNLETLWATWWQTSGHDGINIPPPICRERELYIAICGKENQSIHALRGQQLVDRSRPTIREDPGMPPIVLYGANVDGVCQP